MNRDTYYVVPGPWNSLSEALAMRRRRGQKRAGFRTRGRLISDDDVMMMLPMMLSV